MQSLGIGSGQQGAAYLQVPAKAFVGVHNNQHYRKAEGVLDPAQGGASDRRAAASMLQGLSSQQQHHAPAKLARVAP